MSLWKKITLALVATLLLLVLLIVGLVSTNAGISFITGQAVKYVPGLSIGKVEGNIAGLKLHQFRYQIPGIDVSADNLGVELTLKCLAKGTLCVDSVNSKGINVQVNTALLPASEPVEPTAPLTELLAPLPITLSELSLKETQVTIDEMVITLAEFSTAAQWQGRHVTLSPTLIDKLHVSLPAQPEANKPEPEPVAEPATPEDALGEKLEAIFSQPFLQELPEVIIPVDVEIQRIEAKDLQVFGDSQLLINEILLEGQINDSEVNLTTFRVNAPEGTASMVGKAELKQNWPVELTLNSALNIPELRGEKVKVEFKGDVLGELNLYANVSGPVSANLHAYVNLAEKGLPLLATLESPRLQWPVSGEAQYRADGVKLRLNGKAQDYALSLRSDLSGSEIIPVKVRLDGKGNEKQFSLTRLRLLTMEGTADLSGKVDWSKAISWNTVLLIDGINTAKTLPDWPATLAGKIVTRGSLHGGNWRIDVPELNLTGNVMQQKLLATGKLSGDAAGFWQVPKLNVSLGDNRLVAQGDLGKKWNLDTTLVVPNLGKVLPGAKGTINGLFKLRGSQKAPQVNTNLQIAQLRVEDLTIDKVSLVGDLFSAEQVSGDLKLIVEKLKQGENQIKSLLLTAKGNEKAHHLQLTMEGQPVAGGLRLDGQFNRGTGLWKGNLNNVDLRTIVGQWHTNRAVALDFNSQTQMATIAAHCWMNENAEICLDKTAQVGKQGQASLSLKRVDLRLLKPIVPDTVLAGIFTGRANVSWSEGGFPNGVVTLDGQGVRVVQNVNGKELPVSFNTITLNSRFDQNRASADWLVDVKGNGSVKGNLLVKAPQTSRALSGSLEVNHLSMDLIKPILSDNEQAAGYLEGKLYFAGTTKAPRITGDLNLDKLQVKTQWSPVTVDSGFVRINFQGTKSVLSGHIKTKEGGLDINGDADWRKMDAWRANIAAKGDKLIVLMPPMIQLSLSPDLTIAASPERLKLDGTVRVPWAKIIVNEVPESAVGVSSDEVILDSRLKPVEEKQAGIPIEGNLMLDIGPNVYLEAFGLKSKLKGKLKVLQDLKGLGLHGEVVLIDGEFRAYGQDLVIKEGEIVFAGPPDQPRFNINAIRNPDATEDGVTAGIRVTGYADKPAVELYSEPALSQEETLSYLLRGQGLNTENQDGSMMTSMLIGMGIAKSGKLVGTIGETFGIRDLALDTTGVGDSSQVVVSGYILPGLQVKYGVGIFDSLATLTLRYRLMPRLYLEAVSGVDQALDLLYQFEF